MKKICFIGFIALLSLTQAHAKKLKTPGYFISKALDTTFVIFLIPMTYIGQADFGQLQLKVKY